MAKAAARKPSPELSPNAFIGKPLPPGSKDLSAALGKTYPLWTKLLEELAGECGIDCEEWNSYSRNAGWSLRLKRKDRVIVYLSPCAGSFRASFAMGANAISSARKAVPPHIVKLIDEAKRYAEGTAVRIEVSRPGDAAVVKTLAAIKIEN